MKKRRERGRGEGEGRGRGGRKRERERDGCIKNTKKGRFIRNSCTDGEVKIYVCVLCKLALSCLA